MKALLLACAVLGGCYYDRWAPGTVSAHAPDHDQEIWDLELTAALDVWRSALEGCEFPFEQVVGSRGDYQVWLIPDDEWPLPDSVAGRWYPDGYIQIKGYWPAAHHRTLLHEIGHALGLDHSDDPDSVMASSAGRYLMAEDATTARDIWCP